MGPQTDSRRDARRRNLDELHRYPLRGVFPVNPAFEKPTPYFIDERGTRCAMARLIETASGAEIVAKVHRERNSAYVRELVDEPALYGSSSSDRWRSSCSDRSATSWPDRGLTLSAAATARLEQFAWPGNVRELRNVLERAAILAEHDVIEPAHLWLEPSRAPTEQPATVTVPDVPLEELERLAIDQAIANEGGNRKRAAARLGIGLRTLYDKLRRYGVQ